MRIAKVRSTCMYMILAPTDCVGISRFSLCGVSFLQDARVWALPAQLWG